jgi:hypothetical protein
LKRFDAGHARQNNFRAIGPIERLRIFFKPLGPGQHDGQSGRFPLAQVGGVFTEIMAGSGLRTKNALPPFDMVEIDFQDAAFVQQTFEHESQNQLLALAWPVALCR